MKITKIFTFILMLVSFVIIRENDAAAFTFATVRTVPTIRLTFRPNTRPTGSPIGIVRCASRTCVSPKDCGGCCYNYQTATCSNGRCTSCS